MKLSHINKTYHNKYTQVLALDNISLDINTVGITFIIGPSGCGKTTLLNIIAQKDKNYDGQYINDGLVSYIEQEIMLLENMSIMENLKVISNDSHKIDTYLNKFQLSEHKNVKVKKLSIGQKKRTQIIRSLLIESDYIVCDEPSAALDHENETLIMDVLKEESQYKRVIIVSHSIALMEQLADRVIQMSDGKVVDDYIVNTITKNTALLNKKIKKNTKDYLYLVLTQTRTRLSENLIKGILCFVLCITVFTSLFLFSSLNTSVIEKNKWNRSENIIVPEPLEKNKSKEKNTGQYRFYDIYDNRSISLIKDNVKSVIGYQCGWNPNLYSLVNENSFIPEIDLYEIEKEYLKGKAEYNKTGQIPFRDYFKYEDIIQSFQKRYPKGNYSLDYTYPSHLNFEGFSLNKDDSYYFPTYTNTACILNEENENSNISIFQLFNSYEMPLELGVAPQNNSEVIIAKNLATELQKINGYHSLEDILNTQISIQFLYDTDNFIVPVKISGIAYAENRDAFQVFFNEGAWDQHIFDFYDMNEEKVKYQYIHFLTDSTVDEKLVSKEINNLLESRESLFIPLNQTLVDSQENYQNPINFSFFVIVALITIILFYIIMQFFLNNRITKENHILRYFGYHPFLVTSIHMLFISLPIFIILLAFLPKICFLLNQFGQKFSLASIVEFNIPSYIISYILSLLLWFIIEGVAYGIRTKKYQ